MIAQGTVLRDTYRIIESIGSGGGGEIYLAEHLGLKTHVVIKKIKDDMKGIIPEESDVRYLKNLRHQYLPVVRDYFPENDQFYTVMDYIEGKSFQQLLDEGRKFKAKDIIKWGTQLSEVLVYLHSQKPPIIHRDIKPANIMLTPDENICLIDFNVSIGQEDSNVIPAHSDGYSPPEQYGILREDGQLPNEKGAEQRLAKTVEIDVPQWESDDSTELMTDETEVLFQNEEAKPQKENVLGGDAKISAGRMKSKYAVLPKSDERSDIYSLGATLYHLITRLRPEKATEYVTPLSECSANVGDSLVHIIEKAMQKEPAKRFQSAKKMYSAFKNIKKLDSTYLHFILRANFFVGIVIAFFCGSVACIVLGQKEMAADQYNAYVTQVETAHDYLENGLWQEASEVCERAIQMRPKDLTAHVELANIYYKWHKYEEGAATVKQIGTDIEGLTDETSVQWATLQFLAGECYMELEEFTRAAECYKNAIMYQPEAGEYYTRCAIALVRAGSPEEAEIILEDALQKDISDVVISVVKAEIMLSEKKYKAAEALILEVLETEQDDDVIYHAYMTAVNIYENGADVIDNALEKEKELLEEAVGRLEDTYALALSENLGDVYYELADRAGNPEQSDEYYEEALACFDTIDKKYPNDPNVMQNMAIINQRLGNYEEAEKILLDRIKSDPGDYKAYMYLTKLYIEIQSKVSIEKQDYSAIYENYDRAKTLYQSALDKGESEDLEMQFLERTMKNLK